MSDLSPFLSTSQHCYTRDDLFRYAYGLRETIGDTSGNVALLTNDKTKAILIIASAWINGITFVPIPGDLRGRALRDYLTGTGAEILIGDDDPEIAGAIQTIRFLPLESIKTAQIPAINIPIDDDQVFGIFSTSGSSGRQKLVPLKRRQMLSAAASTALMNPVRKGEYWLHCLPLHHIGGYSIVLRALLNGFGVFSTASFSSEEVSALLAHNRAVTAASLVSTQLFRLLDEADFSVHPAFRFALVGGGPVPDVVRTRATDRLPVIYSYGMTETCAQIITTAGSSGFPKGTSGRVIPANTVSIRNEMGDELPAGQSGLICLKGPQVFDGYLDPGFHGRDRGFSDNNAGKPNESGAPVRAIPASELLFDKSAINEGWFNTGDYGRIDEDGFVFIESRRDDRIVTGGENVDPEEVEQELLNLPGILEAAVIGLPDDYWGQVVTAVIVPSPEHQPDLSRLRKMLEKRLAGYKLPRRLEITGSLPRTELGKIKRNRLRELFGAL
jgi:o-succinylbenzoate---CoA ligase